MATPIPRPQYVERIAPFIGKNIIKVLTGQRRIGKSFIMRQLADKIRQETPSFNIIFINKELEEFRAIRTHSHVTSAAYAAPAAIKPEARTESTV